MRITLTENDVLKECGKSHPVASSIAKLTKATGRARNDIGEAVDALCKLKFINKTDKNEVYLLVSGREYLGMATVPIQGLVQPEIVQRKPLQPIEDKPNEKQTQSIKATEKAQTTRSTSVLSSIEVLAQKLNKPPVNITDFDLKTQVLDRLSELMSDDIAELLLDIKSDLVSTSV